MRSFFGFRRRAGPLLLSAASLIALVPLLIGQQGLASSGAAGQGAQGSGAVFMPVVLSNTLDLYPFGTESTRRFSGGNLLLDRADELGVKWTRLGNRISWQALQPNEGDPIDWSKLADFEAELRALKAAGFTPLVTVKRSPYWAVIPGVRKDGQPTSCGPIRADKFGAFADFMRALAKRYMTPEFNVRHWEIGNEPDVDPDLVGVDWGFGCWGDIDDTEFYGGKHYGEMLKVVGPAIKDANPNAKVWLGGLLLATPETTDPALGHPENFLKGVMEAGAARYIDYIGYHWYPPYHNNVDDHDISLGKWADWGGGTIGKATFIRRVLESYGVKKPVYLNETGLMCIETSNYCNPPVQSFFDMQADYLIRSFTRALSIDVKGLSWFTLNGPGWRYTGLLDAENAPTPAFSAYQELISQLHGARFTGAVEYAEGIEAFQFRRGNEVVQVIWARENGMITITFPADKYIGSYDRDGDEIPPTPSGSDYQILVGFSPVFLVLAP